MVPKAGLQLTHSPVARAQGKKCPQTEHGPICRRGHAISVPQDRYRLFLCFVVEPRAARHTTRTHKGARARRPACPSINMRKQKLPCLLSDAQACLSSSMRTRHSELLSCPLLFRMRTTSQNENIIRFLTMANYCQNATFHFVHDARQLRRKT